MTFGGRNIIRAIKIASGRRRLNSADFQNVYISIGQLLDNVHNASDPRDL